MRLFSCLVLLAAAAAPAASYAQLTNASTRPVRLGIAGGVAVPVGDFKNGLQAGALKRDVQSGVGAQGFLDVRAPGMPLGFRASVTYNRFGFGKPQTVSTGTPLPIAELASAGGTSQILGGLANVTLQLPTGPIRPYVIAGLGAFNVRSSYGATSSVPNASETDFGINGGAGVSLRLGPIDGFVEARLSNVYTKQSKFANLKAVQFVPVTFGFVF